MSFLSVAVAALLVALAASSLVRLPLFHPAQLWSIPWAVWTTLYAVHLLPYKPMRLATALLILGSTAAFVGGILLAERFGRGKRLPSTKLWCDRPQWTLPKVGEVQAANGRARKAVTYAALIAALLALLLFLAFIVQASQSFGLKDALISTPEVRLAIGTGAFAVTIKYLYFSFASVAIAACAAGLASGRVQRYRWIALAAAVGATTYFSTGRSNVVIATIIGLVAYALGRARPISLRHLATAGTLLCVFGLAIFLGVGSLLGKTFENSEIATMQTPFTDHPALSQFALPYEYASAPIAALNERVTISSTWGRARGCATLFSLCGTLSAVGVDVQPEPRIRPFTGRPLPWNTYTALEAPLIDGGYALAVPILGLLGLLVGLLWRAVKAGSLLALLAYSLLTPALVLTYGKNSFFEPYVVGAILLSLLLIAGGAWLASRITGG